MIAQSRFKGYHETENEPLVTEKSRKLTLFSAGFGKITKNNSTIPNYNN